MQRNLAGAQAHDTQRILPFLLRFSESLLSEHTVLWGGTALWLSSCELRSRRNRAGAEPWGRGEGFGAGRAV